MAIWQYDVSLPPHVFSLVEGWLPEYESWSDKLRCFGSEDSDRVHAVFENGQCVELNVRFDFRSKFLEGLINEMIVNQKRDLIDEA